jgi:myosin heavy subunit
LEAEVKYVSVNRPVEVVKFDKTMQFVNELDINLTDMAAAEDINEVDLLNCLKNRFFKKILHTNVGSTLIIMNPYQRVDGNYGEDILDNFLDVFINIV